MEEEVALRLGHKKIVKVLGNPTEGALLSLSQKVGLNNAKEQESAKTVREFGFSSERKRMSKIVELSGKFFCFTKGAPEMLLELCSQIIIDNQIQNLSETFKNEILQSLEQFNGEGLRTLALAQRQLSDEINFTESTPEEIEQNLIFYGFVGMYDPPRDNVRNAIEICKTAGIKVVMITGDHPITAQSIAKTLGIWSEGDKIIEGSQLKDLSNDEIIKASVFARVAPEHKQIIVNAFQSANNVVGMTGDGVNDALALEKSDVGIAMGLAGTDVAKKASDLILTDDSFATIETAVYHGRGLFNNIRANIVFLLVANLLELTILTVVYLGKNIVGASGPSIDSQFLFESSQLVLLYASIHFFPPIGLMFDKYDPNLMKYPPKKRKEPLISKNYWRMIILQMITIAAVILIMWFSIATNPSSELSGVNLTEPSVNIFGVLAQDFIIILIIGNFRISQ